MKIFSLKSDIMTFKKRSSNTNISNFSMLVKHVHYDFQKSRFPILYATLFNAFWANPIFGSRSYCTHQNNRLYRRLLLLRLLHCTLEFHIRTIEHKNSVQNIFTVVNCRGRARSDDKIAIKTSDKGTPFSVQYLQLCRW